MKRNPLNLKRVFCLFEGISLKPMKPMYDPNISVPCAVRNGVGWEDGMDAYRDFMGCSPSCWGLRVLKTFVTFGPSTS